MHISELAPHHVENPREVVSQGDAVNVRILEIDGERRRLSLSLKRVEEGDQPVPRADGAESVHTMPDLRLSEEAFPTTAAAVDDGGRGEDAKPRTSRRGEVVEEVETRPRPRVEAEEIVAEVELEEAEAEAEEIAEEIVAEVELEEAEPEAEAETGGRAPTPSPRSKSAAEQPDSD